MLVEAENEEQAIEIAHNNFTEMEKIKNKYGYAEGLKLCNEHQYISSIEYNKCSYCNETYDKNSVLPNGTKAYNNEVYNGEIYTKLIKVAEEIIELVNIREKISKKEHEELRKEKGLQKNELFGIPMSEIKPHSEEYLKYNNQIINILMNLKKDEVMALQTIMYMGRDKDYDENLQSYSAIFKDYNKYIKSLSWTKDTKEDEVERMVCKSDLGKYLIEGYRILGIDIKVSA